MTDNKYFVNGLLIIAFLFVVSYFLVGSLGRYHLVLNDTVGDIVKIDTATGRVWGCARSIGGCRPFNDLPEPLN